MDCHVRFGFFSEPFVVAACRDCVHTYGINMNTYTVYCEFSSVGSINDKQLFLAFCLGNYQDCQKMI